MLKHMIQRRHELAVALIGNPNFKPKHGIEALTVGLEVEAIVRGIDREIVKQAIADLEVTLASAGPGVETVEDEATRLTPGFGSEPIPPGNALAD